MQREAEKRVQLQRKGHGELQEVFQQACHTAMPAHLADLCSTHDIVLLIEGATHLSKGIQDLWCPETAMQMRKVITGAHQRPDGVARIKDQRMRAVE